MAEDSSSKITSVLIGAGLTLIITLGLRLWQYERERWLERAEWFCNTVTEAADLGTEFWIEIGAADKENLDRLREYQILGFQGRMDGMLATFSDKLFYEDRQNVVEKLGIFREALTGGAFQTKLIAADLDRAREIQAVASELFVLTRQSADRASHVTAGIKVAFLSARSWLQVKTTEFLDQYR